jgi:hypothetical protein
MSEDLHSRVLAFLRGEFGRTEGRQCVRLELSSAQPGLRGDVLRTWDRHEDPELFVQLGRIEELATSILRITEDHADSFGSGQHRFELRTEQHHGGRQKLGFRILAGAGDGDSAATGEDAPTAMGMVAQQMRHNELHMRMSAQMYSTTLGTMQRQIAELSEDNARLRRERNEHYVELEEARSRRDERELAGMRQMASENRKDLAFGKLLQLAPVVAGRLLGKGSEPSEAPSPLTILIGELAASLTPEQIAHIGSALSQNQQILFVEAMREAMRANSDGNPAASAPAPAAGAPSAGTNGAQAH